jgi:hypothetical protein
VETKQHLAEWSLDMKRFIAGEVSANDFRQQFFARSNADRIQVPADMTQVVDDILWALECYNEFSDPSMWDDGDLDSAGLLSEIQRLSPEFDRLLSLHTGG